MNEIEATSCRSAEASGFHSRREDAQLLGVHRKKARQRSCDLAVEFHWNITRTCNLDATCLEIFHIGQLRVRAEGYRLKIPHDIPVGLVLKDENIQQSIIQTRPLKNGERSAIKTTVPDQGKRPLVDAPTVSLQYHAGGLVRGDLHKCEKVAERSQCLLGISGGFPNHFGIESHSGELNEVGSIGLWQVNGHDLPLFDNAPGALQIAMWNTKLAGENIHRSNRKNTQLHWRVANTVDDFVQRAIPTRRDDDLHSVLNGLRGDAAGVTSLGGEPYLRST